MESYEKIQGLNGYRWKPNASQKAEYAARMKEKESLPTFTTNKAIRNGCIVEFYNVNKGQTIKGEVVKNSYGPKTKQHTFTILDQNGEKHLVKGRNLYPNIITHVQGEDSKKLNKPNLKKMKNKKTCTNRVVCDGLGSDGRLKKGYNFQKGTNNVIKKTATKKTTATAPKRKPTPRKKSGIFGLGILGIL